MLLLHAARVLDPCLKPDPCSERAGNFPCPVPRDLDPAQSQNRLRGALASQAEKQNPLSAVRSAPCSGNSRPCSKSATQGSPVSAPLLAKPQQQHQSAVNFIHNPSFKGCSSPPGFPKGSFPLFLSPHHQSAGGEHTSCALLIPGGTRLLQAWPRRAPGIPPVSGHSRAAPGVGVSVPRGVW